VYLLVTGTWLFLPEISSKWMKLLLGWLHGASLKLSDLKNPEFRELQELLGIIPFDPNGPFWETFWAEERG
jgi:hypothetical protein